MFTTQVLHLSALPPMAACATGHQDTRSPNLAQPAPAGENPPCSIRHSEFPTPVKNFVKDSVPQHIYEKCRNNRGGARARTNRSAAGSSDQSGTCRIYRLAADLLKRKTWGGGAQNALCFKLRCISTIFVCGEFVDSPFGSFGGFSFIS
jgi:hypothetical protein